MEDTELRSAFHAAYDTTITPAPWLAASISKGLHQRTHRTAVQVRVRLGWVLATVALVLIVAIAIAVIVGPRLFVQPTVPGAQGWSPCGPVDNTIPHVAGLPDNPSPLPAAVPPGYGHECGGYAGSTDSPAALAEYFRGALTGAGWSVNTVGTTQGFVVTTWVPDPKVTSGPEPGYRPAFTGLTGDDVASASTRLDANGTSWLVDVRLTPQGAALFARLTQANVAACPTEFAGCPERHLAEWIGLTQDDIDHWEDFAYANHVSQPFDSAGGAQNTDPKLVVDAVTLQLITGGVFEMGASSRESADYLALGFNTRLLASHTQLTFTKGHAFGVIDLVPAGDVTAIWVRVVS